MKEYLRLYIALHGDHEGDEQPIHWTRSSDHRPQRKAGTSPRIRLVSSHLEHALIGEGLFCDFEDLVASALSDPYISYAAALFGLAGPLHGWVSELVAHQ